MAEIYTPITVDVAEKNTFAPLNAKQFDIDSRFLVATIIDNGTQLVIPTTASVQINARRADNAYASYAGTVNSNGTVTVPLSNWMLALDDTVTCDISIIAGTDKLTTLRFYLDVEKATNPTGGQSPDTDPTVWEQMQLDVAGLKAKFPVDTADINNEAVNYDKLALSLLITSTSSQVIYDDMHLPTTRFLQNHVNNRIEGEYSIGFDTDGSIKQAVNITGFTTSISGCTSVYAASKVTQITSQFGRQGVNPNLTTLYIDNAQGVVDIDTSILNDSNITIYYRNSFHLVDLLVGSMVASNNEIANIKETVTQVNTALENAINGVSE